MPRLKVAEVVTGLSIPWGLAFAPDGTMLVTEREGRLLAVKDGRVTRVQADLGEVRASGEGGLLDLALSPTFASDRLAYLCHNSTADDVRVTTWTLNAGLTAATKKADLVTGLPMSSGRHSGCRLLFGADGRLYIGTGDAAQPTNPQDLTSLGGKVLRVDPVTGKAPADNPFADRPDPRTQLVWTYGHRNVQGLSRQPGTDALYSVEHGSSIEDEVNLLTRGANYGWNPAKNGTSRYDESGVPMTDGSLPGVVAAVWNSGDRTIATSGATFLRGRQWGALDGALVVACLKGSRLVAMRVHGEAPATDVVEPEELRGTYGRLRTAVEGPDGALYVATSNGHDMILRVTPDA